MHALGILAPRRWQEGQLAIGKVRDGDVIEIIIDRINLTGSVNLVGEGATIYGAEHGAQVLAARPSCNDVAPHPALPNDTQGYGRHCNRRAAARGAAVCIM